MDEQMTPREGRWRFPTARGAAPDAATALRQRVDRARDLMSDAAADARERTWRARLVTESAVARQPFRSLAIAVGVGALIGVLAARLREGAHLRRPYES